MATVIGVTKTAYKQTKDPSICDKSKDILECQLGEGVPSTAYGIAPACINQVGERLFTISSAITKYHVIVAPAYVNMGERIISGGVTRKSLSTLA